MVTEISSLRHPLVKEWCALRTEKQERTASGTALIVGQKMVRELSRKIELKCLITSDLCNDIAAEQRYLVTDEILRKITGVAAPDGFAAVAPLPMPQPLTGKRSLLILDGLSDPGNLGTLLRSALALSCDGALLIQGTVDPFNDKALRASKGAPFFLPFDWQTPSQAAAFLQSEKRHVYLADLAGKPLSSVQIQFPCALILGSEGAGVSPWAKGCGEALSIPMRSGVDSLNVAAAGAIFLYAMGTRQ